MADQYGFLGDTPYVIAEIGSNHGGDVETAKEYATAAAESGVDAVKFQLYKAENLIVKDEPPLPLAGEDYDSQYERFKELELTREGWLDIISHCESLGVDFSASIFGYEMLEFASDHIQFVKIASGDLTNLPLLRKVAETGMPIVLSTGFATFDEINTIMSELEEEKVVLLHCMGCYPTEDADANLETITRFSEEFAVPVGYSDHTKGTLAPIAAAAKGAKVIEKHFTLDKSIEIGDHRLSATPDEMAEIVEKTKRVAKMSGQPRGDSIYDCEDEIQSNMRRSLATNAPIKEGHRINEDDLTALRPSDGISPLRYDDVVGAVANTDIEAKTVLRESDINI